ncbi:GTPase [Microtetraspora malaysiensis]|uniref:GTPase n=1 Tax=Microtetraspora malaysiensis TaxID=161358 RepID=A0ABW6T2M9_9ACTN
MKPPAWKTPDDGSVDRSGHAENEEQAIDHTGEHPETPGEQTVAFRPIQDGGPADSGSGDGDHPALSGPARSDWDRGDSWDGFTMRSSHGATDSGTDDDHWDAFAERDARTPDTTGAPDRPARPRIGDRTAWATPGWDAFATQQPRRPSPLSGASGAPGAGEPPRAARPDIDEPLVRGRSAHREPARDLPQHDVTPGPAEETSVWDPPARDDAALPRRTPAEGTSIWDRPARDAAATESTAATPPSGARTGSEGTGDWDAFAPRPAAGAAREGAEAPETTGQPDLADVVSAGFAAVADGLSGWDAFSATTRPRTTGDLDPAAAPDTSGTPAHDDRTYGENATSDDRAAAPVHDETADRADRSDAADSQEDGPDTPSAGAPSPWHHAEEAGDENVGEIADTPEAVRDIDALQSDGHPEQIEDAPGAVDDGEAEDAGRSGAIEWPDGAGQIEDGSTSEPRPDDSGDAEPLAYGYAADGEGVFAYEAWRSDETGDASTITGESGDAAEGEDAEVGLRAAEGMPHDAEVRTGDAEHAEDATGGPDDEADEVERVEEPEEAAAEEVVEVVEADEDPVARVRAVPLPEPVSAALTEALNQLRLAVEDLHFGLDIPGAEEARKAQAAVLAQLEDYVIPRVHMSTAPALIVVAGSTGAGKSTLVNTLAAQRVSMTGVRRPTTGTPVLVCHPDDHEWFAEGDLLGGLTRLERPVEGVGADSVVLSTTERLPPGVALLDTPDIDSVVEEHHEIAHRMLDAADLWVFVTTASRYADAPSWNLLRLAKERGARLVIVLSRVPEKSRDVIVKHFGRMLDEYGLADAERFVIKETAVTEGRLPDKEVSELRMWLAHLSVDDERRAAAVRTTLNGVLDSFRNRVPALARHLETQVALRADLRSDVDAAYMGALADIDEATRNGSLLRGEVLARWQDFAGSGDLIRTLQLRRGGKGGQQGPERARALRTAIRSALENMINSAAERAAEEVVARWRQRAGAGDRLAATPGLGRSSGEVAQRTARAIGAWQDHVTELIRTEGVTKRSVARLVSFDVESLALIFTVGLLGYGATDVSSGRGAGALPQRLLRALLGAEPLRNISAKARSDLRARIGMVFDEETLRYVDTLDGAGIPDEAAATRLYQATYNLEVAR